MELFPCLRLKKFELRHGGCIVEQYCGVMLLNLVVVARSKLENLSTFSPRGRNLSVGSGAHYSCVAGAMYHVYIDNTYLFLQGNMASCTCRTRQATGIGPLSSMRRA